MRPSGMESPTTSPREFRPNARVIEQRQQSVVVDREVADHAALVERGPRVVLVVIGQTEGVQHFVIGAVEEHAVAFVDDDE